MKVMILSAVMAMFFAMSVQAQSTCTVKSPCGDFMFEEAVSASSAFANGVTTVTVTSVASGAVLFTTSCEATGGTSTSCADGEGDICDIIPDRLKPIFGCDE